MPDKKPPADAQKNKSANVIDWNVIHRRLEGLRAAIDEDWHPPAAQIHEILSARARRLAEPPLSNADAAQFEILEFSLGAERYGIVTDYVREVYSLTDFTPVPCTPAFVIGVANVRGEIISLLDLRHFFAVEAIGITDLNKVIVVTDGAMQFGIVVDGIAEVRSIVAETLLPSASISGIDARYLLGVTADHVAVLDAQALLSDKAIVVDEGG